LYVAFTGQDTPHDWQKRSALRKWAFAATFAGDSIESDEDFHSFSSGELKWNIYGNQSARDAARDPKLIARAMPGLRAVFRPGNDAFDRSCAAILQANLDEFNAVGGDIEAALTRRDDRAAIMRLLDHRAQMITLSDDDARLLPRCGEALLEQSAAGAAASEVLTREVDAYLAETKPHALSLAVSVHRDAASSDYGQLKVLFARNGVGSTYNFNGFVAVNREDRNADGATLRRIRDYGVEAAATIGTAQTATASLSFRRDSASDNTVILIQAKTELALAGAIKLPVSFSYADQQTATTEQGFHVALGVSSILDSLFGEVFTRR
jgi:hypothetical protein